MTSITPQPPHGTSDVVPLWALAGSTLGTAAVAAASGTALSVLGAVGARGAGLAAWLAKC